VKESAATLVSIVPEDKESLERVRREAKLLGAIDSRHVVRYIMDGEYDDRLYIVMAWAGSTLEPLIAKEPIDERRAGSILIQAATGLEAAYKAACTAHRDIKPPNLFLNDYGIIQVGDFGIAKLGALKSLTVARPPGTPRYKAPEWFTAPGTIDARYDVYALGVVLCLLLTGNFPLSDPGDDLVRALHVIETEPPKGPNDLKPGCCSDKLHALTLRMLAKAAVERPTCTELIAELGGEAAACKVCPHCYAACEWEDRNCGACGGLLAPEPVAGVPKAEPIVLPPRPAPPPEPAPMDFAHAKAWLLVVRPDGAEVPVPLKTDMVELGRAEIAPGHRYVSRRHARLARGPEGWRVTDLDSLNGTFLNALRIERDSSPILRVGDRLMFGDVLARFEAEPL
jgi:hypothetical protein